MKINTFMNCFYFLAEGIKKYLPNFKFKYYSLPNKSRFGFYLDYYSLLKKITDSNNLYLKKYSVIHINNYVSFLLIKYKKPGQVWIAESHGYHFGLGIKESLADSEFIIKLVGFIFGSIFQPILRNRMKKFDVYCVAIPNILEAAKKVRKDAFWLPNPISDFWFEKHKNIKVDGSPAIFFPTRLHKMKEPEHGFEIFENILKKYPNAKLHLVKYPERFSQYFFYETFLEKHKERIVWHNFVKREKLAEMYHSFDLVLGAFGKGLLNLVELEAMASGAAVVSYDRYEFIKKEIEELPAFALKLLSDKKFKTDYVKHSKEYVKTVHGSEAVAEKYKKIIDSALKKKSSKD